ncbi:hypothetical protein [Chryseobacterium wangxinyae]|uniref:hypothetical protein n=1 Tax=unclassified Chryseobacterium TaxID=2593645 RepID=UPI002271E2B1|nr:MULTISPECIES: hypothetical protein [unclassified Chryseobacterium]MCY0968292.1 hypothetical protein [Chryseobacterium sp. CY353]MCY0978519.1 hypothetical protein [Chryseobacterium sp. CY350]WBZ96290.1 hypothetical protein PGH12_03875 [Chryseobacterium sp. CY350]
MKGLLKVFGTVILAGSLLVSCVVHQPHGRRMPPGQAKKIYGGSAKHYAPGQVKKRGHHHHGRH